MVVYCPLPHLAVNIVIGARVQYGANETTGSGSLVIREYITAVHIGYYYLIMAYLGRI